MEGLASFLAKLLGPKDLIKVNLVSASYTFSWEYALSSFLSELDCEGELRRSKTADISSSSGPNERLYFSQLHLGNGLGKHHRSPSQLTHEISGESFLITE